MKNLGSVVDPMNRKSKMNFSTSRSQYQPIIRTGDPSFEFSLYATQIVYATRSNEALQDDVDEARQRAVERDADRDDDQQHDPLPVLENETRSFETLGHLRSMGCVPVLESAAEASDLRVATTAKGALARIRVG